MPAEGDSPWYACAHDEFALVMDGRIEVRLMKPEKPLVPEDKQGAIRLPPHRSDARWGASSPGAAT
jgi:hypothetical protein